MSGEDYASAGFIQGRLRLFRVPTMPMDASIIASKPDTTPEMIAYEKSGILMRQVMIEHTVQDTPRMKAKVILLLPGREGIFWMSANKW
jgi:hypothetical protein